MRKQPLVFIAIIWVCATSVAQETYLDVVINYTPTSLSYGGNNSALKDYKKGYWGLQAGASLQAGITQNLSLVPELYFVMKGGRLEAGNPLNGQETRIRFNAIDLPVMARIHLWDFYVNAGPVVSYNLGGHIKTEASELQPGDKAGMDFGDTLGAYSRWDAGVQFGVGYGFKIKNSRLLLDVRYHYGLVDVGNGADIYNRYLNMNILFSKRWKKDPLAKRKKEELARWEQAGDTPKDGLD